MNTRLVLLIVIIGGFFLWQVDLYQKRIKHSLGQSSSSVPTVGLPTSSWSTRQEVIVNFQDTDLETVAKEWAPGVLWESPTPASWNEGYYAQPIPGYRVSGSIVAEDFEWHGFNLLSYGDNKYIKRGWTDSSIAADRPGASQWGYQRVVDEKIQVVVFDYVLDARIEELEPGVGGVKFVCPCTHRLSVFLGDPFPYQWSNLE